MEAVLLRAGKTWRPVQKHHPVRKPLPLPYPCKTLGKMCQSTFLQGCHHGVIYCLHIHHYSNNKNTRYNYSAVMIEQKTHWYSYMPIFGMVSTLLSKQCGYTIWSGRELVQTHKIEIRQYSTHSLRGTKGKKKINGNCSSYEKLLHWKHANCSQIRNKDAYHSCHSPRDHNLEAGSRGRGRKGAMQQEDPC